MAISEEELVKYFHSDFLTSDDDGFRYFLPRLFEIKSISFDEITLKLEHAEWKNHWPANEIEVVEKHLEVQWRSVKTPNHFEDYLAFFSFSKLLSLWKADSSFLISNVECWEANSYFSNEYFSFPHLETRLEEHEKIEICAFLEKIYFDNIECDPDFAKRISQVNNWFDWYEPKTFE